MQENTYPQRSIEQKKPQNKKLNDSTQNAKAKRTDARPIFYG